MASSSMNGVNNGTLPSSSSSQEKNYTPLSALDEIYTRLLKTYYSGKTKNVKWRKDQLKNLAYLVQDNMDALTG